MNPARNFTIFLLSYVGDSEPGSNEIHDGRLRIRFAERFEMSLHSLEVISIQGPANSKCFKLKATKK
jgi:hypothetical protein